MSFGKWVLNRALRLAAQNQPGAKARVDAGVKPADAAAAQVQPKPTLTPAQLRGNAAEDRALDWLLAHGLTLVQRNYRVARGARARGGEIDLVMRDRDGTLVFVEVRARASRAHGGAAASVTASKRRSLLLAAQHYLLAFRSPPPCRFDVVSIEGDALQWLPAAFDATG